MWEKFKLKIKQKKKKMGIQTLTLVIGAMMGLIAIGGLADLSVLHSKFSVLSTQTGYVSRVISDQGGVSTDKIENYHGKYTTSGELYNNVKSAMNNSGIHDEDWEVHIDGKELSPGTHVAMHDYGERIPVEVKINYGWIFTSNFVPSAMKNDRTSKTEVISTYRIRDEGFTE